MGARDMFEILGRMALWSTVALILCCLFTAAALAQASPPHVTAGVTLDLVLLQRVTGLLSFVLSVGAVIYTFFATRRKDVERRFHEGSKRMDRHDLRLQALEQDVTALPGKDDLHRVEMSLGEIAGDMKAISATMAAMSQSIQRTEKIVGRHEDHLREGK